MVSGLTYSDMIDKFIGEVVSNHQDADILAKEWSLSKEDNLGRAGWTLIVRKVASGKLDEDTLSKVHKALCQSR